MSKILITRSVKQGQKFVEDFCEIYGDHTRPIFQIESMIRIRRLSPDVDFDNYDVFLATSQNAVFQSLPRKPIFRVGMDHIQTAEDLIKFIQSQDPTFQYLYLRGVDVRHNVKSRLNDAGFFVDEAVVYEAVAEEKFTTALIQALKNKEIAAITFFSARTAQIFMKLSQECRLLEQMKSIKVLCISCSVLDCLYSDLFKDVRVAKKPSAQGMMELIKEFTDEQSD